MPVPGTELSMILVTRPGEVLWRDFAAITVGNYNLDLKIDVG